MARYICDECNTIMELLWEENKVICPKCGCWEEITDEEVEDFDGDDEPCSACGNPAYPKCKISCSFFDD